MALPEQPRRLLNVRTRTRPAERWRPIPFFERYYEVSDRGRARRVAPSPRRLCGNLLVGRRMLRGRMTITLRHDVCEAVRLYIDGLVEQVFQRPAPDMAAVVVDPKDLRLIDPELRRQDRERNIRTRTGPGAQP